MVTTLNVLSETESYAITAADPDRPDLAPFDPIQAGPPDPPPPLPTVAGMSAEQMADLLNVRVAALLAATADVVIRDDGTLALPPMLRDGTATTEGDLIAAEDRIIHRAEDLRTHAQSVLDATESAAISLSVDVQRRAAELTPLVASQCDRLPLPEVMNRVRAAVVSRDSAMLSLFADLLPGRLATVPASAGARELDAAKELRSLLGKVRADLVARYADPSVLKLRETATALRRQANGASGRASKRRTSERALHRLGAAAERLGLGKTLVPILNADGSERRDATGAVVMKYYDESTDDYAARKALDAERDKLGRRSLVIPGVPAPAPPAASTPAPAKPKPVRGPGGKFVKQR